MNTKPYDQAFKYLAEQEADAMLHLLGVIRPDEQARVELLPREISVPALLTDQAYLVTTDSRKFIAHAEAQAAYDYKMPERMPEYDVLLWLKYRLPVYSFVLLLTRRNVPRNTPTMGIIEFGGSQIITNYQIIRLWEIPAAEMLALKRDALLPFVPLMDGQQTELEAGVEQLRQVADERRRRDLALHFVMLGGLRYNRADLLEMIGRNNMIPLHQLKDSSFYQYILDEGIEKGIEKGREMTLTAIADLFRMLAAKRFSGLQLGSEVEAVGDIEALKQLCLELDEMPDAAVLERRLLELAAARNPQS